VFYVFMRVSDFDFSLPEELIAQEPTAQRGDSKLLTLSRNSGTIVHSRFENLGAFLSPGDLLVFNNTRVVPARLLGRRVPTGGAVECVLLKRVSNNLWEALVHPGQKLGVGAQMEFTTENIVIQGRVLSRQFFGRRTVQFSVPSGEDLDYAVEAIGHVPLPPYIKRNDESLDRDRYQTVYASKRGAVAAPTAGLHFTKKLIADLDRSGIEHIAITLHIGYGTFKPVRSESVEDHVVDLETFTVDVNAAQKLSVARHEGRRIIAVGTSTVRALESLGFDEVGNVIPVSSETDLFVYPGYEFQIVGGLITNFHLPRSSLIMLVSAFAGRERILAAYAEAVEQRYRFYSYGDAMLIL
jgi:S-adenosylmethionine:tRNA ribosyltransferase-isomerase